ncbi:MAG: DUF3592 domain-containing protein [Candidatus Caenarcaniphilales bacterium]|nr:DUF3592 domain-containing protein [Candidatus Caenarcaniphilales bacterium]
MLKLITIAIFFAFGCLVSKLAIDLVTEQIYYDKFISYEATILSSDYDQNKPRVMLADYRSEGNLSYQYSYNGKIYNSNRINALTMPVYLSVNPKTKFMPGSVIKIYVNPDNPAEAVAEKGQAIFPWLFLGLGFSICFYAARGFLLQLLQLSGYIWL